MFVLDRRRHTVIQKLSHATFYVLDQQKAVDFYTNKLGLEIRTDMTMDNGFRWVTVGPKGQPDLEIVLYAVQPGGMIDEESAGLMRAVLEKGAFGVGVWEADDCRATYEELKAKGVEFVSPPQEQPYGIEAVFKDGCGNYFSLTQHR
jgi:catechol 2,3-dioxygenase-like lactoylglutathione lyase family enzyme